MKRLLPALLLVLPLTAQTPSVEQRFRALDRDADGVVTEAELPQKAWRRLLDADGDGRITLAEALAGAARLRGARGLGAAATSTAEEAAPLQEAPVVLKAAEHGVGRRLPNLALRELDGREVVLSARLQGARGLVLAFFGATCPISGKLGPELARLEKHAEAEGLRLVLVCPVPAESAADMRAFTAAHGLGSPVVHDRDGALATALAATTTTECFLVDAARTLVYRGAINDQYGLGYAKEQASRHYLREAVAALLSGDAPEVAATTAPGCALDQRPAAVPAEAVGLTYHHQIERILQAHCIECHRRDGVAPFSLETYEDVVENAGMIRRQVERGVMPPWFAAPPPEGVASPWSNDAALPERDKAELLAWLAGDRPRGNPAAAPLPRRFPAEWELGAPDAIVQLTAPIAIKAEGTMPYQFVTVPTDFAEDRWVRAYEILPTDRSVVHHVIVQVHEKGARVRDRGEGSEGYWAAYVPGNTHHAYPSGFAKKLPAGATVSFQIHYTPNGRATRDQLRLGLHSAKEPPRYVVHTAAVAHARLNIPPHAARHVEIKEQAVPFPMNLTGLMAHMHVRGRAFKFEVLPPGGGEAEVLLDIPRYDFNWQLRYDYAQPKFLPAGSRVRLTAVFDNSAGNPANPDPDKTVRWGPQTHDEMMIGYFEYFTPRKDDVAME
jgi:mono/diheme cytochrome c family protein